jgi:hypothetical protein
LSRSSKRIYRFGRYCSRCSTKSLRGCRQTIDCLSGYGSRCARECLSGCGEAVHCFSGHCGDRSCKRLRSRRQSANCSTSRRRVAIRAAERSHIPGPCCRNENVVGCQRVIFRPTTRTEACLDKRDHAGWNARRTCRSSAKIRACRGCVRCASSAVDYLNHALTAG